MVFANDGVGANNNVGKMLENRKFYFEFNKFSRSKDKQKG
jgi:hypothetical protein